MRSSGSRVTPELGGSGEASPDRTANRDCGFRGASKKRSGCDKRATKRECLELHLATNPNVRSGAAAHCEVSFVPEADSRQVRDKERPGSAGIRTITLSGIVSINSDISSSDLDTDKILIESDTEALSKINDGIGAVGSNAGDENRSSPALVNCLGRLNCGRGESLPDELA